MVTSAGRIIDGENTYLGLEVLLNAKQVKRLDANQYNQVHKQTRRRESQMVKPTVYDVVKRHKNSKDEDKDLEMKGTDEESMEDGDDEDDTDDYETTDELDENPMGGINGEEKLIYEIGGIKARLKGILTYPRFCTSGCSVSP